MRHWGVISGATRNAPRFTAAQEVEAMRRAGAIIVVLLLAGAVFSAAGCNTVRGVGQDVSAVGRAISDGFR